MLRGMLAPIGTGVGTAVSDESAELAKTLIEGLGSNLPFWANRDPMMPHGRSQTN